MEKKTKNKKKKAKLESIWSEVFLISGMRCQCMESLQSLVMFEEVNYGMNKRNLWGPRKRRCCCQSGKAYKNISKKFGHKSTARQIVYKLSGPPTKITQKARHVIDPKVTSDTRSLCIQGKNDSVFLYIKNKVNRMSFGFEMLCFLREIMQTFGMSRNLE